MLPRNSTPTRAVLVRSEHTETVLPVGTTVEAVSLVIAIRLAYRGRIPGLVVLIGPAPARPMPASDATPQPVTSINAIYSRAA